MPEKIVINLAKPIASAKVLGDADGLYSDEVLQETQNDASGNIEQARLMRDLKVHKAEFSQTCQTLKNVVGKFNEFCDEVFAKHREEIARLSVEIAKKILMQEIDKGNYQIEAIVKEALENAPTRQDVVVRLNPKDLVQLQRLQQENNDNIGILDGIKFVAEPNIGPAQCVVDSPKGIIESLIDEHLKRIGEALKKAE